VIGAVLSLGAVAVSIFALVQSNDTADKQATFEQEQSAPVLAPEASPKDRGKTLTVHTAYRTYDKRADRMLLTRRDKGETRGHLVIPVRNGGAGLALTVGVPLLVQDCVREPERLPTRTAGLLGTYVVPSGSSDQLGYFEPPRKQQQNGNLSVAGERRWYRQDYRNFGGRGGTPTWNVLLWYTDGARRKLRWTCTNYGSKPTKTADGEEYAVRSQIYGSRNFPRDADSVSP
jgi:hypothetical protein